MDVIITYKKNDRVKRLSNIEFTEFDMILKRFFYWEFGKGEKGKSIALRLVHDIKVNASEREGQWKKERQALLEMTGMMDEHPEGYEGPCLCKLCCSYG